jgi:hypothetical protein
MNREERRNGERKVSPAQVASPREVFHRRPCFRFPRFLRFSLFITCAAGCVETGKGGKSPDAAPEAIGVTCQATPPVPYAGVAPIPFEDTAPAGPYLWKNVVIKGGGFVSGIITSPVLPGLLFARTDVGGAYRHAPATGRWLPLTDWVGHDNSNLIGIESIAADPIDPNRVYLAAGTYTTAGNGAILRSTDMGRSFTRHTLPTPMGGNADGRSTGERLVIDPNLPTTLYFGSRTAGLWRSTDAAETWAQVPSFPTTGTNNGDAGVAGNGLTFVVFDRNSGVPGAPTPAIYVGVGITNDASLYRSLDAGVTWEAVAGQPAGLLPHHAAFDGCGNVYFTFNDKPGPNGISKGAVWRYETTTGIWTDVSPPTGQGGFGGISADPAHPGTLIVTTLDRWVQGDIYRTTDGGASWVNLAKAFQRDVNGALWLGWHTNPASLPLLGWMGDVEIDPFAPGHVLFITGQGIWSTSDATAADTGAATHWKFDDDGLEETVVLDLVSPPVGAQLLSGVGDIAGFRHDDLDVSPADGMFGPPIFGNTNSLDFAEAAPNIIVRVGTSSSAAKGAYSTDGGATWIPFPAAPANSGGQGSIAVSADGSTLVWAPASLPSSGGVKPPAPQPSYSRDRGTTWTACTGLSTGVQLAADRVNPATFYASGRSGTFVSTDGGVTFVKTATLAGRPRPVFGIEGDVWIATSVGLYHSQDSGQTFVQPSQTVNAGTAVGFGMAAPGQSYPSIYLAGAVSVVWGTYRSDDAGVTWQRIDDVNHQFGSINCLTGDPRKYGRIYLGTGGRGIIYGDIR